MPEINTDGLFEFEMDMRALLVYMKAAASKTAADTLINAGAVDVMLPDEERKRATRKMFLPLNAHFLVRVGRKWFKPILSAPTPRVLYEEME